MLVTNCAVNRTRPPEPASETLKTREESQYYYFLESQLQKKRGHIDKAMSYIQLAAEKDHESNYLKREYAFLLLEKKEYQKALLVVEDILQSDPDHIDGLIMLGSIKQTMKQMEAAKSAFEKVLAKDPKRKNVYLLLGSIYMKENNLDKALDVYGAFVENFPESYIGYFFLGKIFAKQGRVDDAEEQLKQALAIEPMLLEPRFELIDIYKTRDDGPLPRNRENIIQTYKDILERYPQNIRAAMELGIFYHRIGSESKAEPLFRDLGQRSRTDRNIIEKGIILFMKPKRYEDAIIVLNGMLKTVPESSDIHYLLGAAHDGMENDDVAVKHFQKVNEDSKFFENAVIFAVSIFQKQGRSEEAIDLLKNAITEKPATPDFYMFLGHIYEEKKAYEASEAILKQGINNNKNDTRLIFRLGVVYDKWGKKDESIREMKKVITLDPKNAQALNYLGYTYVDLDMNLDEAEQLIRKAVELAPEDGYITDSLGWLYYKRGRFQEAVDLLEKAIALVPDDPIILEHLGDAHLKLNDRKKALEYYKRSLSMKNESTADLKKKIEELSGRDEP